MNEKWNFDERRDTYTKALVRGYVMVHHRLALVNKALKWTSNALIRLCESTS